ncbi:hypothetical protein [Candidatus Protochlamydia amoebophila]|uniref:hypothetical protein n=1 Tax=Candidatus Protochlamydia amoebophila TaxID=362787 RepID=UPI000318C142|nr:hypothetical protein [Candidatus Protochlamydia amoebophila]
MTDLTITEKYCRAEELGKEWYYSLPESLFVESLKTTFANFYSNNEKQYFVA